MKNIKNIKNIILSIILFSILIISLFFLNSKFINLCDELSLKGSELEFYLDNNEMDIAYNKSLELLDFLDSESTIPCVYLNHADYDLLINECLKVCIYIKNKDLSEAQASVHLVVFSADHLKEMNKINIKNIF